MDFLLYGKYLLQQSSLDLTALDFSQWRDKIKSLKGLTLMIVIITLPLFLEASELRK